MRQHLGPPATVLGLVVAVTLSMADPAWPATPRCSGHVATIVGTEDDDELVGTDGPDVVVALGGDDRIDTGDGNDVICAGAGLDDIYPGDGDDLVWGGSENDRVSQGSGTDTIQGGSGRDSFFYAGGTGSSYSGERGNDQIVLTDPDTPTSPRLVSGGPGNDSIQLTTCTACTVRGGSGDDDIVVGSSQGVDVLGGPGSDSVQASITYPGDNSVDGGPGPDGLGLGLVSETTILHQRITLDLARGWISVDGDRTQVTSFQDAQLSTPDSLASRYVLRGTDGPNWLAPSRTTLVPVTVIGRAGRDRLHGGNGDDLLRGGPGKDRGIGYGGDDTCLSTEKSRHCEIFTA
jgi:Ca2+-binding RTX toxin-like protein